MRSICWFTNEVVTIRERNRNDSVSRESIRTKRVFIERNIQYAELILENFEEDSKQSSKERIAC